MQLVQRKNQFTEHNQSQTSQINIGHSVFIGHGVQRNMFLYALFYYAILNFYCERNILFYYIFFKLSFLFMQIPHLHMQKKAKLYTVH